MSNDWIGLPDNLNEFHSVVYLVECTIPNEYRYYVGVKQVLKRCKLKPLKDGKKRKAVYKDNGLLSYYGSSNKLLADIETNGVENYSRKVLHLCKSKSEAKYLEACEQFIRNVLFDDRSYNEIVNLRIGRFKKGFTLSFDDLYQEIKSSSV